jgi:hypothetical protein
VRLKELTPEELANYEPPKPGDYPRNDEPKPIVHPERVKELALVNDAPLESIDPETFEP